MNINKGKAKTYAVSIAIALIVGGLSALFTNMGMDNYRLAEKPALTPPEIVFPIVWTILFTLMGISAARVWIATSDKGKSGGLLIYIIQLFVNFLWSIFFFNLQAYGFSFFWLLFLWALILIMIISFSKTDKIAAYLQIPYFLWVSFAAYLNFMVWMLNK